MLERAGFALLEPAGRLLRDDRHHRPSAATDDVAFARHLVGDSAWPPCRAQLLPRPDARDRPARDHVRFCFCKKDETLAEAERRLERLAPR